MKQRYSFLSAAVFALVIFFCGSCGSIQETAGPEKQPEVRNEEQESAGEDLARKRLKQVKKHKSFLLEHNRAFANNYYLIAKHEYEDMKIEFAYENLKLALRYDPEHFQANKLMEKVQGLLEHRPAKIRSFLDRAVEERNVKTEQMVVEIKNLISEGDACFEKMEFNKAKEAYKAAILLMDRLPYYVKYPADKKEVINKLERINR